MSLCCICISIYHWHETVYNVKEITWQSFQKLIIQNLVLHDCMMYIHVHVCCFTHVICFIYMYMYIHRLIIINMLLLDNSLINFQADCWLKHHFTCKFISMVNTLSFMTFNQIPFKIKFKLWQPCQICNCTCVKNKLTTLVIYKDTFIYFCLCWFSGGQ